MKTLKVKSKWFNESNLRIDAKFHLSDGPLTRKYIENSPFPTDTIGNLSKDIFYGGRSKRVYVSEKTRGIPFMGSSDMLKIDFNSLKLISKKNTNNLNDFLLKEGWTLISRSGTIGNTAFVNKNFVDKAASEHIIRVVPKEGVKEGFIYAYLTSKYGYSLLTQGTFGGVIQHIEPSHVGSLIIPIIPIELQNTIHNLILKSAGLLTQAQELLQDNKEALLNYTKLASLTNADYEFFGNQSSERKTSTFKRNIKEISSISINAFNNSAKISRLIEKVKETNKTLNLFDVLNHKKLFSTGSFPRKEVISPRSITLINQSDIFNFPIVGKRISRRNVKADNLVTYGEVIIAGVGTLGENETFCKVLFANEELVGQLISGEFLRMQANETIPSGYLYMWLSSEYGFRFIRSTHTGTKLCRPIQKLLYDLPVPILSREQMNEIHEKVIKAYTLRYHALLAEKEAIQIIENEIESWQD